MTVYSVGSGHHLALLPEPGTTLNNRKAQFWFEMIYTMAIAITKYSVLPFYRRLFPSKSVLRTLQVVALVVLAWQIAIIAGYIWECRPVQKAWDTMVPGTCIDLKKLWLGNAIPSILTGIVIIIIPLPRSGNCIYRVFRSCFCAESS